MKKIYEFILKEKYFGSVLLVVESEFNLENTKEQVEYLTEVNILSYCLLDREDVEDQDIDVTIDKIIRPTKKYKYLEN